MTIPAPAVDAPFKASVAKQIIDHINLSAGRFIFKSNGTFTVPNGVHQFRVYMAGRGGDGGNMVLVGENESNGFPGGVSPLISAIFSGYAVGTSFAVTVGDGTNDGTTKFGTLMQCTAGANGDYYGPGAPGTPTFPLGQTSIYHDNGMFGDMYTDSSLGMTYFRGYGSNGRGAYQGSSGWIPFLAGMPGVCVIEW